MSVISSFSPSSPVWTSMPACLFTKSTCSFSKTTSRSGGVCSLTSSFRGVKKSSGRYRVISSPATRRSSPVVRLPFFLIFLVRNPLYSMDGGRWGRALVKNLSSRCPASFSPIINCFIPDTPPTDGWEILFPKKFSHIRS